jgi:hypothetical protein
MSNDKLYNISNIYMIYCGIDWWDRSLKLSDVVDYRFLTSISIRKQSILIAYTIKLKRANPVKRICPH